MKVEAVQETNVITIRVVDPTAKGAAQLANAVAAASKQIVPSLMPVRAAVPEQAIQSRPGRPMAIGMLLGLFAAALVVWWRTRRNGPTRRSSTPERGRRCHPRA
jgi:capsular polysaccharide biosynthesis protein